MNWLETSMPQVNTTRTKIALKGLYNGASADSVLRENSFNRGFAAEYVL